MIVLVRLQIADFLCIPHSLSVAADICTLNGQSPNECQCLYKRILPVDAFHLEDHHFVSFVIPNTMATQLGLSTLPPMASSPYVGSVDSFSRYSLTSQAPFLTRALYFPSHSNSTTHLPLYNITDSYRESVGHHGVDSAGASRTQLDSIERPSGNSWNDDVRFLIDYDPARQVAALTERTLERDRCEINMYETLE